MCPALERHVRTKLAVAEGFCPSESPNGSPMVEQMRGTNVS